MAEQGGPAERRTRSTMRMWCAAAVTRRQFRLTRAKASAPGTKVRPERSAEYPSPSCRCSVSAKSQPPKISMSVNMPPIPVATPGAASSARGRIGWPPRACTSRSTGPRAAASSTLAASSAQPQAGQPSDWPRTSGSTNASTAGVSVSRPGRSSLRCGRSASAAGSSRPKASTASANRNVDEEDRPPRAAGDVRADQQAAEHLAEHHAAGQDGGVQAHRLRARRRAG